MNNENKINSSKIKKKEATLVNYGNNYDTELVNIDNNFVATYFPDTYITTDAVRKVVKVPASVSTLSSDKLIDANTVVKQINKKVIKFFMLSILLCYEF